MLSAAQAHRQNNETSTRRMATLWHSAASPWFSRSKSGLVLDDGALRRYLAQYDARDQNQCWSTRQAGAGSESPSHSPAERDRPTQGTIGPYDQPRPNALRRATPLEKRKPGARPVGIRNRDARDHLARLGERDFRRQRHRVHIQRRLNRRRGFRRQSNRPRRQREPGVPLRKRPAPEAGNRHLRLKFEV